MKTKHILIGAAVVVGAVIVYRKFIKKPVEVTTRPAAKMSSASGYNTTCQCSVVGGPPTPVEASCATQKNCCKAACSDVGMSWTGQSSATISRTR